MSRRRLAVVAIDGPESLPTGLLTTKDVQRLAGISRMTVLVERQRGRLRAIKIGKAVRFEYMEYLEWLKKSKESK